MDLALKSTEEIDTAAMEIVSVYHMLDENQSFRSAICNLQLIKNVYGKNTKFSCSQTKSAAILKGSNHFIL